MEEIKGLFVIYLKTQGKVSIRCSRHHAQEFSTNIHKNMNNPESMLYFSGDETHAFCAVRPCEVVALAFE